MGTWQQASSRIETAPVQSRCDLAYRRASAKSVPMDSPFDADVNTLACESLNVNRCRWRTLTFVPLKSAPFRLHTALELDDRVVDGSKVIFFRDHCAPKE
jgi:hypothetical protein